MSTFVRNVLNEQRKRAVASILTHAESRIYAKLTPREQSELRSKIIASITQYHDTCLDLVKASVDEGTTVNEEALRLLHKLNTTAAMMSRIADDG